jgi:hypothetical protein
VQLEGAAIRTDLSPPQGTPGMASQFPDGLRGVSEVRPPQRDSTVTVKTGTFRNRTLPRGAPFLSPQPKLLTRLTLGWFLLHQGWGKVVQEWAGGRDLLPGEPVPEQQPRLAPRLHRRSLRLRPPLARTHLRGAAHARNLEPHQRRGLDPHLPEHPGRLARRREPPPRHMLMIYTPLAAWYFFEGPGRFSLDTVLLW